MVLRREPLRKLCGAAVSTCRSRRKRAGSRNWGKDCDYIFAMIRDGMTPAGSLLVALVKNFFEA
jgi:hypothetical protein